MAVGTLKLLAKLPKVPAALWQEMAKSPSQPTTYARPQSAFYLAVRWSGSWAPTSNAHHGPPDCDQGRFGSRLPISLNYADEQTMRLRPECSPILRSAVGRMLAERRSDYAGVLVGLLSADTTNSSSAVHERMTALQAR